MGKISAATSLQRKSSSSGVPAEVAAPLAAPADFVMMCLLRDGGLDDAIHSLYYLPPQFKLRVLADSAGARLPFAGHEAVKNRISFATESGIPLEASPLSSVDAVVYSEATPVVSESATPRVVISKTAHNPMQSAGNIITITEDSPEALASAVLRLAKTLA